MESIRHFWKSKSHAIAGLRYAFRHEQNFRSQLVLGLFVIAAMILFQVTSYEVIIIILMMFFVLVLELFNTTIEALSDVLKPRLSGQIAVVKDVAAGMVLLSSVVSVIIGGIIFYPYVVRLLGLGVI